MTLFQPASRLAAVSVSPIMALSARAARMRAEGGLDLRFDSSNAQGIFKMTASR